MHILVTGGTGWIGRTLCRRLSAQGHQLVVWSRRPARVPEFCGPSVSAIEQLQQLPVHPPLDAVINLAGAPIADRPWTESRRHELRDSRIDLTRHLVDSLARLPQPPRALINASAIGYYGDAGDTELDETSPPQGDDFASQLCRDWEAEAREAEQRWSCRVVVTRFGLVLGPDGGLLSRMAFPARLGLGARLGNGRQWMSWVHRDDVIGGLIWLLGNDQQGVFNITAPNPVRNDEFTRCLAEALGRRAFLVAPAPLLKLAMGEMSILLLGGQRVLPRRTQQAGYGFQFSQLETALSDIFPG